MKFNNDLGVTQRRTENILRYSIITRSESGWRQSLFLHSVSLSLSKTEARSNLINPSCKKELKHRASIPNAKTQILKTVSYLYLFKL